MPDIGVRELKARASEIIRNVRKRQVRYIITYRGRPVGLLIPLEESAALQTAAAPKSDGAIWQELTRLGAEIARGWRSPLTSTEILSRSRR